MKMPLQEFAPATICIPNGITIKILNWNSHGCRSKLLQRQSDQGSTLEKPMLCLAKHWLYKILSKFFRLPGNACQAKSRLKKA